MGAALSTLITYTLRSILTAILVRDFLDVKTVFCSIIRSAFGSFIMVISIVYLFSKFNVYLEILFGAIVYFIIMLFIGLEEEDKKIISGLFNFIKEKLNIQN